MSDVVRPGDTLLVAVTQTMNREAIDRMLNLLRAEMPGVKIIAVCAAQFAVFRPEETS